MDGPRSETLFDPAPSFEGLPEAGFEMFTLPDRVARRKAIVQTIHPGLRLLAEELVRLLNPEATTPLHSHIPRLDWPRDYEPFCTWAALSPETHGYLAGPQLNLGVHADHVSVRLGWDATADAFGRFEFLCRHSDLGRELIELADGQDLVFRVYSSVPWPEGSRCVFESRENLSGSLNELRRHGIWWELGRRFGLPGSLPLVTTTALRDEALRLFRLLLPVYGRILGH